MASETVETPDEELPDFLWRAQFHPLNEAADYALAEVILKHQTHRDQHAYLAHAIAAERLYVDALARELALQRRVDELTRDLSERDAMIRHQAEQTAQITRDNLAVKAQLVVARDELRAGLQRGTYNSMARAIEAALASTAPDAKSSPLPVELADQAPSDG